MVMTEEGGAQPMNASCFVEMGVVLERDIDCCEK